MAGRIMPSRLDLALALVALMAFVIGLTLPDVDLVLGLGHRSALTHSVLPAMLVTARRAWRGAAAGIAGGSGVHLAADCFPNAMIGYATVKLPVAGALAAGPSYLWLALNALAALAVAVILTRRLYSRPVATALVAAGAASAAAYLWRTDGGWPVLTITAIVGSLWIRRVRA